MKNELTELINGISEEEFERFGDFIKSPFFNKQPRLVKFYEFMDINFKDISEGKISKQNISVFMYPEGNFESSKIRKLISDTNKLLERFITYINFETDEWQIKINHLEALSRRNRNEKFWKKLSDYKFLHNSSTEEIDDYYGNELKLKSLEFFKFAEQNLYLDHNPEVYQERSDYIDYEFISKKLTHFQSMTDGNGYSREWKFSHTFWDEIKLYIEKNKKSIIKDRPEIYKNYLIILHQVKGYDRKILLKIRKFVLNSTNTNIYNLYWDYISECTFHLRKDQEYFYKEILFFIKLLDEKDKLSGARHLEPWQFLYGCLSSLCCGEIDFMENFILKNKSHLKHPYKDNLINIVLALLYLEKSDLEKSYFYSKQIKFISYWDYFKSKEILIRIAYDKDELFVNDLLLETGAKYLSSHEEVNKEDKLYFFSFIKIVKKLAKLKEKVFYKKDVKYELINLLKEVQSNQNITLYNKKWLLKEFNKLLLQY